MGTTIKPISPKPPPEAVRRSQNRFTNTLNQSGNASPGQSLKRMKLVYRGTEVKFQVNPEDYTQTFPQKVTVTQTKGGAWIDSWGAGLQEFTIKGITGVRGIEHENIEVGYERWRQLRSLFNQVSKQVTDGEEIKDYVKLYNYTDNEYWNCYPAPGGLELYRSKSRPHVYQYTIHLIGIGELGQPKTSSGVIGNPNHPRPTSNSKTKVKSTPGIVKTSTGEGPKMKVSHGGSTKAKQVDVLDKQIDTNLKKLSKVLDGQNGKINVAMSYELTQTLKVSESGVVSNVPSMTVPSKSDKLPDSMFNSDVGYQGAKLQKGCEQFNPKYIYAPKNFLKGSKWKIINRLLQSKVKHNSELLHKAKSLLEEYSITRNELNQIKVLMISVAMVYRELNEYYTNQKQFTVSTNQMKRYIQNANTLCTYFGDSTHAKYLRRIDLVKGLREIEKTLTEINTEITPYL